MGPDLDWNKPGVFVDMREDLVKISPSGKSYAFERGREIERRRETGNQITRIEKSL